MAAVLDTVRALFAPDTFTVAEENPADVVAREALLDRQMGADRRRSLRKSCVAVGLPAEGLALVARDTRVTSSATVRLWQCRGWCWPRWRSRRACCWGRWLSFGA